MKPKACRDCRLITTTNICPTNICPNCKTSSLSEDWIGELIIFNPDKSKIAQIVGITKPGKYALLVRG
jgi:DNA-directed RNA polymerase subunit E"